MLVSILDSHVCDERCKVFLEFGQVESDVVFVELGLIVVLHMLADLC